MRVIADTNIFILVEAGNLGDVDKPYEVAASIVTLAELYRGVLTASGPEDIDRRTRTYETVRDMDVVLIDEGVAHAWALLVTRIKAESRRPLKTNDAWIAATALAEGVPVLTMDGDFDDVPNLDVERLQSSANG